MTVPAFRSARRPPSRSSRGHSGGSFRGATFGPGAHGMTACMWVTGMWVTYARIDTIYRNTRTWTLTTMHIPVIHLTHAQHLSSLTYTRRAKALQRYTTKQARSVADPSQPARPSRTCRFLFPRRPPPATSQGGGGGGWATGYSVQAQSRHPLFNHLVRVRTSQASTTGGKRSWGSASSDPTSHTEAPLANPDCAFFFLLLLLLSPFLQHRSHAGTGK